MFQVCFLFLWVQGEDSEPLGFFEPNANRPDLTILWILSEPSVATALRYFIAMALLDTIVALQVLPDVISYSSAIRACEETCAQTKLTKGTAEVELR